MSTIPTTSPFPRQQRRPKPKGVRKARMKHRRQAGHAESESEPESEDLQNGSTFYQQFFSLPAELRTNIYRLLLVQPCKFDMYHNDGCTRLVRYDANWPGPHFENHPLADLRLYRCANCAFMSSWPDSTKPVFVSPARSRWGDALPNEFLCDGCWHSKFGNVYRPSMVTLPCLCTRRQNLDILLVNKRINREASYVFWTENHFAFENSCLLDGFLNNIRIEIQRQITRISLMAHDYYEANAADVPHGDPYLPHPRHLKRLWEKLGDCSGLVDLELDSHFLSDMYHVLGMRRLQAKRSVTFFRHPHVQEVPKEHTGATQPGIPQMIWPALAFRQPIEDSTRHRSATRKLASELAASIVKGRQLKLRYLRDLCKKSLATQKR